MYKHKVTPDTQSFHWPVTKKHRASLPLSSFNGRALSFLSPSPTAWGQCLNCLSSVRLIQPWNYLSWGGGGYWTLQQLNSFHLELPQWKLGLGLPKGINNSVIMKYFYWGAGLAQWLECQTWGWKVTGLSLQEQWENFSSPESTSVLTLIPVSVLLLCYHSSM